MTTKGKSLVIAQNLRNGIISGKLPAGTKFETIPKFAAAHGTTIATIGKVFGMLENEGLIERVNGLGVFVKKRAGRRYAVVFDSKAEFGVFAHKAVFMQCFIEECLRRNAEYVVFENIDSETDCMRVRKVLLESPYDAIIVSSRGFARGIDKYLKNIPIQALGLYEYKWMNRYITFSSNWILSAGEKLRKAGCSRIALVTIENDRDQWMDESRHTASDIYQKMCSSSGGIMRKDDLYVAKVSPREGYIATCRFLDSLVCGEKAGMIVTDSILTHGAISAILQRGLTPMQDIMIVSHANKGAVLSEFPLSVWTYEADIAQQAEWTFRFLEEYGKAKTAEPFFKEIPLTFQKPQGK